MFKLNGEGGERKEAAFRGHSLISTLRSFELNTFAFYAKRVSSAFVLQRCNTVVCRHAVARFARGSFEFQ